LAKISKTIDDFFIIGYYEVLKTKIEEEIMLGFMDNLMLGLLMAFLLLLLLLSLLVRRMMRKDKGGDNDFVKSDFAAAMEAYLLEEKGGDRLVLAFRFMQRVPSDTLRRRELLVQEVAAHLKISERVAKIVVSRVFLASGKVKKSLRQ